MSASSAVRAPGSRPERRWRARAGDGADVIQVRVRHKDRRDADAMRADLRDQSFSLVAGVDQDPRGGPRAPHEIAVLLERTDGEAANLERHPSAGGLPALLATVHELVGVVDERHVERQHDGNEQQVLGRRRVLEEECGDRVDDRSSDCGPPQRALPGRRRVVAVLARPAGGASDDRRELPFSVALGLRPVRPRDSIIPAALPRCLVFRVRGARGICRPSI